MSTLFATFFKKKISGSGNAWAAYETIRRESDPATPARRNQKT
jgi:hypothetical protein